MDDDPDDLTSHNSNSSKRPAPLTIYQYDNKLAQAFQSDCENLIQKFTERKNLTFKSFSELWIEKCFVAIFKNQDVILGVKLFLENCFFITKKFLYASDLCIQTAALYILYGLYYKQPIKNYVKIRLTQGDFDKLEEIVKSHKSSQLLDPLFIFSKMRVDGAFEYCVVPQFLGIEVKHMKRLDIGTDLSNEKITSRLGQKSVICQFKNLMEEDPDLVQFEETDDEYQRLSQKYKDQLFIFPSEFGESLKKSYSELFDVQLEQTVPDERDKVKIAKNKAMLNINAVYRGERKVLTAMDFDRPSTSK